MWESWTVLAIFIVNLAFMLIMSFVSPFFKVIMAKGVGKIFNIVWMCVIIAAAGVLMFYNVRCTLDGGISSSLSTGTGAASAATAATSGTSITANISKTIASGNCRMLAVSIVVFLLLLTILNMAWGIYNTLEYNKKNPKSANVTQEHR